MSVKYASLRPYPATPGTSPPALPLPPNHQLPYNFQCGVIPPPPAPTELGAGRANIPMYYVVHKCPKGCRNDLKCVCCLFSVVPIFYSIVALGILIERS